MPIALDNPSITFTRKLAVQQTETTKISYYNLRFCLAGVLVPCHIPDTWAYRAHKGENEKERDLVMALLTLPRVCFPDSHLINGGLIVFFFFFFFFYT